MTCDSKGMKQIFPPLIYKNIYAQITAIIQCNPFLIKDTYREVLKTVYKTVKLVISSWDSFPSLRERSFMLELAWSFERQRRWASGPG